MRGSNRSRVFVRVVGICAIVLLVLVALAGCGCGNGGNSGNGKTHGTVSEMKVNAGQDFTISLQSNHTTGFQWRLAAPLNKKIIQKVNSVYKPDESGGPDKVGAGGVEIWTFRAVSKGSADIMMKYARSNEKGVKPAEERVFKVTVE